MFRAPFSKRGRIRRLEFGLSLIIFAAVTAAAVVGVVLTQDFWLHVAAFLGELLAVWFLVAQAAKRAHDAGYSLCQLLLRFCLHRLITADGLPYETIDGDDPKGRLRHDFLDS